jgi:hypothetical protein
MLAQNAQISGKRNQMPWPNQSPEPTAVGAVRYAVAVHAARKAWLNFLR